MGAMTVCEDADTSMIEGCDGKSGEAIVKKLME